MEIREGSVTPRVSPSRAPVLSFAHYFQAPATQAKHASTIVIKDNDFLLLPMAVLISYQLSRTERKNFTSERP